MAPNPTVEIAPLTVTLAKSARLASIVPTAAHPPRESRERTSKARATLCV